MQLNLKLTLSEVGTFLPPLLASIYGILHQFLVTRLSHLGGVGFDLGHGLSWRVSEPMVCFGGVCTPSKVPCCVFVACFSFFWVTQCSGRHMWARAQRDPREGGCAWGPTGPVLFSDFRSYERSYSFQGCAMLSPE